MLGETLIWSLSWYAIVVLIGAAAFPITKVACKNLSDQGYCVSKIVGILILTYLSWILSYVLSFSRSTIFFALAILCTASLLCAIKMRPRIGVRVSVARLDRNSIIRSELIFLVVFMLFLTIRAYNPEITDFGEKFMDFAFLNAIAKSAHFPPHDPWFAGGAVNFYYYFGYLIVAVLSRLSGISTSVAYNLGLVTFSALAATAAFGIGYNLTRKVGYGIWTMVFVVFIANPYIVFNLAGDLLNLPIIEREQLFGYWASTRIVPHTINEFPYFSFIFGDLHPHVIAIPFQLLLLTLMLGVYRSRKGGMLMYGGESEDEYRGSRIEAVFGMLLFALALGALLPINAWDYPTYVILFVVMVVDQQYHAANRENGRSRSYIYIKNAAIPIIATIFLSILLFLPFHLNFQSSCASGIEIAHQKTLLVNFIEIFALFLFLIFSSLFLRSDFDKKYVILAIPIALLAFFHSRTLLITLPLILIGRYLLFKQKTDDDSHNGSLNNSLNNSIRFVLILIVIGALLATFCEIFYLNDRLGAPNDRMNTIFKLYLQIWIFWGIASGYCLYDAESLLKQLNSRIRTVWVVLLFVLVLSCVIYPFTATGAKIALDNNPPTLDGILYLNGSGGSDRGDYLAISWIRENIAGTPVILEAPGRCYTTDSRISAFTGLPTVIGWQGHEMMWRSEHDEILARAADGDRIYNTQDMCVATDLLNKYNVSYVYIGATERARYGRGLDKFEDEDYFECVYIGSTRIYMLLRCS